MVVKVPQRLKATAAFPVRWQVLAWGTPVLSASLIHGLLPRRLSCALPFQCACACAY